MKEFFIKVNGKERGPFAEDQINSMWYQGRITSDTFFRESDSLDWEPMSVFFEKYRTSPDFFAPDENKTFEMVLEEGGESPAPIAPGASGAELSRAGIVVLLVGLLLTLALVLYGKIYFSGSSNDIPVEGAGGTGARPAQNADSGIREPEAGGVRSMAENGLPPISSGESEEILAAFQQEVATSGKVWFLEDSEGNLFTLRIDEQNQKIMLFWSNPELMTPIKEQHFNEYNVASMDLFDFLYDSLPSLKDKAIEIGIDWPTLADDYIFHPEKVYGKIEAGLSEEQKIIHERKKESLSGDVLQRYQKMVEKK